MCPLFVPYLTLANEYLKNLPCLEVSLEKTPAVSPNLFGIWCRYVYAIEPTVRFVRLMLKPLQEQLVGWQLH